MSKTKVSSKNQVSTNNPVKVVKNQTKTEASEVIVDDALYQKTLKSLTSKAISFGRTITRKEIAHQKGLDSFDLWMLTKTYEFGGLILAIKTHCKHGDFDKVKKQIAEKAKRSTTYINKAMKAYLCEKNLKQKVDNPESLTVSKLFNDVLPEFKSDGTPKTEAEREADRKNVKQKITVKFEDAAIFGSLKLYKDDFPTTKSQYRKIAEYCLTRMPKSDRITLLQVSAGIKVRTKSDQPDKVDAHLNGQ